MKGLALAFFVAGLALGLTVRFPTFALFTVAALGVFAALNWTALSTAGLSYQLVLVALALQLGYYAAGAARMVLEHRRRKARDRKR